MSDRAERAAGMPAKMTSMVGHSIEISPSPSRLTMPAGLDMQVRRIW